MSRHRNVRSMDYKEEYEGYDDVFGHSVDDEGCISPTDAQQWIYDRARGQQSIATFMASNRDIQEEDEGREDDEEHEKERRDSESYQLPELPDDEMVRLMSVMDEIRSIVGDSVTEKRLVETIMRFNYDMAQSLDSILNPPTTTACATATKITEKESSPAIEKDCNPVPNTTPQTFNNLRDLINSRLDSRLNNTKKFSLPKLNTAQGSSTKSPGIKFNLPKLSNIPKISPKLQVPSVEKGPRVDDLSIDKLSLEEKSVEPMENSRWVIDLTTALITTDSSFNPKPAITEDFPESETFKPQFVDCDIDTNLLAVNITQYCQIDLSPLLRKKLKQRTRKPSKVGSILCRKFRKSHIPKISMKFEMKNTIEPFNFTTPSPDDYCLKFLRR